MHINVEIYYRLHAYRLVIIKVTLSNAKKRELLVRMTFFALNIRENGVKLYVVRKDL